MFAGSCECISSNVTYLFSTQAFLVLPVVFIARRSKRGTCYSNVAGWVAGCLSHAGIVSKRLNLS